MMILYYQYQNTKAGDMTLCKTEPLCVGHCVEPILAQIRKKALLSRSVGGLTLVLKVSTTASVVV